MSLPPAALRFETNHTADNETTSTAEMKQAEEIDYLTIHLLQDTCHKHAVTSQVNIVLRHFEGQHRDMSLWSKWSCA